MALLEIEKEGVVLKLRNTGQRVLLLEGDRSDFMLFVALVKYLFKAYKNVPSIEELVSSCPACRRIAYAEGEVIARCPFHDILIELARWSTARRRHNAEIEFSVKGVYNDVDRKFESVEKAEIKHIIRTRLTAEKKRREEEVKEKVYTIEVFYDEKEQLFSVRISRDFVVKFSISRDDARHWKFFANIYNKFVKVYEANLHTQM